MRTRKLSLDYFSIKNNRILRSNAPEDRKLVIEAINRINKNENLKPIEITYLSGSNKLSIIEGSERLKACEVTKQKSILVNFINRNELTKNIFKREFKEEKVYIPKDKHVKHKRP